MLNSLKMLKIVASSVKIHRRFLYVSAHFRKAFDFDFFCTMIRTSITSTPGQYT
jgi:hypothetical protein